MEEKGTVGRSKRAGGKKKLQANDVTAIIKINKKPKTSLIRLSIKLQAKSHQRISYSTNKRTLNDIILELLFQ